MFRILFLSTFLCIFCFSSLAPANGFVEAQVKYKKLETGKKDFSFVWDETTQQVSIHLGLDWYYFKKDWHTGGFNLSDSQSIYISFPELPEGCEIVSQEGVLFDIYQTGDSFFDLVLEGESCKSIEKFFGLLDVTVTLYQLSPLGNSTPPEVLRIVIYDHNQTD